VATIAILFVMGGRRAARAQGPADAEAGGILTSIKAGLRYVWSDPPLRSLILLIAAFNFAFSGPLLVGLPFLASNGLHGDSATFGILLAAFGAGAVVGAVISGSLRRVPRLGVVILTVAIGLGIGLGLIGVAPNVAVALGVLAPMGLGVGFINVQLISWLQVRSAAEMRGRVMSLVMLGAVGLAPISYALAGATIDLGPVPLMFGVAGAIVIVASLLGFASGVAGSMSHAGDA
jgi:MFS family permease